MPLASMEAYLNRLDARMAEVKLMMADVVNLPHMKKGDRQAALNQWMSILRMRGNRQARPASKARLKMMGIGVRFAMPPLPDPSPPNEELRGEREESNGEE